MSKNPAVPSAYFEQFKALLGYFGMNDPEVIDYFSRHTFLKTIEKGEFLLVTGGICEGYYFICSGALRGMVLENGKEITTWISVENELVTSISSIDQNSPAFESIQALEDCVMIVIHKDDMFRLYEEHPQFNITGRKVLEAYYKDAEKRAFIARLNSAENKYKFFLESYPHLINRIPLKFISSYLGMTLETLSRVRGKISRFPYS